MIGEVELSTLPRIPGWRRGRGLDLGDSAKVKLLWEWLGHLWVVVGHVLGLPGQASMLLSVALATND